MYGDSVKTPGSFAANCLQARRLVEKGVRFVQLFHQGWDNHGGLPGGITHQCQQTDQASAGLIQDLKQRGLLEDTLVWWGSEFGRQPYAEKNGTGRDHNPGGFTMWLAGGGMKPGFAHGSTDDFGQHAISDKVHMHDLHATILHSLGIDHERLTYRFAGRDFRLTDVYGDVMWPILA
jgi:hypothetical protein